MNMFLFFNTALINSNNQPNIINSVILTAVVFAAIVTSVTNLIICIANGQRLKKIEKQKQQNEIDKYRYTRLYELILNWHKFDSEFSGESVSEITANRLINSFLDNTGRYEIAKPLLDDLYKKDLDIKLQRGQEELTKLINASKSADYSAVFSDYVKISSEFSDALKGAINKQLELLLLQNR